MSEVINIELHYTEVFLRSYNYAGKADFSNAYWNPKRKLGVTTHFSEIISNDNS